MTLDPKEFERVFTNHFEHINPSEFLTNLKKACPDLMVSEPLPKSSNNSNNVLTRTAKNIFRNKRTRRNRKNRVNKNALVLRMDKDGLPIASKECLEEKSKAE